MMVTNKTESNVYNMRNKIGIEVVPVSNKSDEVLFDDEDGIWGKVHDSGVVVPYDKYTGSGEWSPEVKKRGHTEVGSGGESVPDGVGSRKEIPGEGSSNAEKRFKMGEMIELDESPNAVNYNDSRLSFDDGDAIPFGYYDNRFHLGNFGGVHAYINPNGMRGLDKEDFRYAGRLWLKSGVISFWEYPEGDNIGKVVNDLESSLRSQHDLNIDTNKLKIETISRDEGGKRIRIVVPYSEYIGSGKLTPDEYKEKHLRVGSGGESVPDGVGSRKDVSGTGNSNAEKRFKMGEIYNL
jgi:hypothetical protein